MGGEGGCTSLVDKAWCSKRVPSNQGPMCRDSVNSECPLQAANYWDVSSGSNPFLTHISLTRAGFIQYDQD